MDRTNAALITIAAQKQCAAGRWIDIEHAPKDGARVILGRQGYHSEIASWPAHLSQAVQANKEWPRLTSVESDSHAPPTHFALINQLGESP